MLNRLNQKLNSSPSLTWTATLKRSHRRAVRPHFFSFKKISTKVISVSSWIVRFTQTLNIFLTFFISHFEVAGLSNPVFKDYQRTLIQERDRDMAGDHTYNDYNLFSCLSRLVDTFLSTLSSSVI